MTVIYHAALLLQAGSRCHSTHLLTRDINGRYIELGRVCYETRLLLVSWPWFLVDQHCWLIGLWLP
jgi:hypothetical protein